MTGEIYRTWWTSGGSIRVCKSESQGDKDKCYKQTTSSDADGFFEFTDLEAGYLCDRCKEKKYRDAQQKVVLEEGESEEIEIMMKKTSKRIKELQSGEDGQ